MCPNVWRLVAVFSKVLICWTKWLFHGNNHVDLFSETSVSYSLGSSWYHRCTLVLCAVYSMAGSILWYLIYFRPWTNELCTTPFTVYRILLIRSDDIYCYMILTWKTGIKWPPLLISGRQIAWQTWFQYICRNSCNIDFETNGCHFGILKLVLENQCIFILRKCIP